MPHRNHCRHRLTPLQVDCFLALISCFFGVVGPMLTLHLLGLA